MPFVFHEVVERVQTIAPLVTEGALTVTACGYKFLNPQSGQFVKTLPDEYQARVAAEIFEIRKLVYSSKRLYDAKHGSRVDWNNLVDAIEYQKWRLELSKIYGYVLRHPKFDLVVSFETM